VQNKILEAPDKSRKRKPKKNINRKESRLVAIATQNTLNTIRSKRIMKYYDNVLLNTDSTTTVGFDILTAIPQGSAQSQRVADTVEILRIDVRMYAFMNSITTDYNDRIRFSFLRWLPNTGSYSPSSLSIYQSTSTFSVLSPFTFETRKMYHIFKDLTIVLAGYTNIPTARSIEETSFTIPIRSQEVQFNLGGTTGTGHIYFVNYSDSSTTPHPQYSMTARVWYFDQD